MQSAADCPAAALFGAVNIANALGPVVNYLTAAKSVPEAQRQVEQLRKIHGQLEELHRCFPLYEESLVAKLKLDIMRLIILASDKHYNPAVVRNFIIDLEGLLGKWKHQIDLANKQARIASNPPPRVTFGGVLRTGN